MKKEEEVVCAVWGEKKDEGRNLDVMEERWCQIDEERWRKRNKIEYKENDKERGLRELDVGHFSIRSSAFWDFWRLLKEKEKLKH